MKNVALLLFCLLSFKAFSADKVELNMCKDMAHQVAFDAYSARFGEGMIFTKNKFKPVIEQNSIIHFIEVLDSERNTRSLLTVSFNKSNCQLISVD